MYRAVVVAGVSLTACTGAPPVVQPTPVQSVDAGESVGADSRPADPGTVETKQVADADADAEQVAPVEAEVKPVAEAEVKPVDPVDAEAKAVDPGAKAVEPAKAKAKAKAKQRETAAERKRREDALKKFPMIL